MHYFNIPPYSIYQITSVSLVNGFCILFVTYIPPQNQNYIHVTSSKALDFYLAISILNINI